EVLYECFQLSIGRRLWVLILWSRARFLSALATLLLNLLRRQVGHPVVDVIAVLCRRVLTGRARLEDLRRRTTFLADVVGEIALPGRAAGHKLNAALCVYKRE